MLRHDVDRLVWRSVQTEDVNDSHDLVNADSTAGICSGKSSIAEYLVREEGFTLLELTNQNGLNFSDGEEHLAYHTKRRNSQDSELVFDSVDSLLEFVTKRWRERWVITDIWDSNIVDRLLVRPFFLLVSVDAPVSIRWQRFRNRQARFLVERNRSDNANPYLLDAGNASLIHRNLKSFCCQTIGTCMIRIWAVPISRIVLMFGFSTHPHRSKSSMLP